MSGKIKIYEYYNCILAIVYDWGYKEFWLLIWVPPVRAKEVVFG